VPLVGDWQNLCCINHSLAKPYTKPEDTLSKHGSCSLRGHAKVIREFLGKNVKPEPREKLPSIQLSCKQILTFKKGTSTTINFEHDVFSHLCRNKKSLGINKVYWLKRMLVDGLIELSDGTVVLVEVKYALNWRNTCIARVEINKCLSTKHQATNALIIFDHFSADWAEQQNGHKLVNGWNRFYEEENMLRKVSPIPIDIAQLTKQGMYQAW
jgi:hypothetical protein